MDPLEVLVAVGNFALVAAVVVGLVQLRTVSRERQEELVLRAYAPFLDPAMARAYWQVVTWDYSTFERFDTEATLDEKASLNVVRMEFETMGLLYKRGLADIDFMADLLASPTILTWNKIAPIVIGYRAKTNAPDWSRWHEELARALDVRLTELGRAHPAMDVPFGPAGAAAG